MLTGKCMFKHIVGRKEKNTDADHGAHWTEKATKGCLSPESILFVFHHWLLQSSEKGDMAVGAISQGWKLLYSLILF